MGKRIYIGLFVLAVAFVCLGSGLLTIPALADEEPWEGNIYIFSDGSYYPSNAPLKVSGKNYKLTSDVEGRISITCSGITLNGNGYTLTGDGTEKGVYVDGQNGTITGISIKNLKIEYCRIGILCYYTDESKIINNEISDVRDAIYLMNSDYNMIVENNVKISRFGIYLGDCDENKISSNDVQGESDTSFGIVGIYVRYYSCYNKVNGNYISKMDYHGICVNYQSDYNKILGNTIEDTYFDGIYLSYQCDYNTVIENSITNCPQGIEVGNNNCYNVIRDNSFIDCYVGMYIWNSYYNIIKGNYFEPYSEDVLPPDQPTFGIAIDYSDSNTFTENVILNSIYAFWVEGSYDNVLYHNDMIGNEYPFSPSLYGEPSTSEADNTWDNGKGEGNYWSDYEGEDTDNDGIGDTDLPHNGVDNYPLMEPYN